MNRHQRLEARVVKILGKYKKQLQPGKVSVTRAIENLDLSQISVVTQMRTEFTGIEDLAESIASEGLIQLPTISVFNAAQAKEYLDLINFIHKTSHKIGELKRVMSLPDQKSVFYVLTCGERRFRALKYLWEIGCERCRKENKGSIPKGVCFKTHFPNMLGETFYFSVSRNTVPPKALLAQFAENSYIAPGAHALAAVYAPWYKIKKLQDSGTTIKSFAHSVGKSPQTISKYIGYIDLPLKIRNYVETGKMNYASVSELSRYMKAGATDRQIEDAFIAISLYYTKASAAKRYINGKIEDLQSNQIKIFEMNTQRPAFKKIVDPKIAKHLSNDHDFFTRLGALINDEFLVKEDDIFTDEVQLRLLARVIDTETGALPVLEKLVNPEKFSQFVTALEYLKRA